MKKLILGSLLFAMGMLGVIAMIVAAIVVRNEMGFYTIWLVINSGGALAPFVFFCLMSVAGLALFVAKPIIKFIVDGFKN